MGKCRGVISSGQTDPTQNRSGQIQSEPNSFGSSNNNNNCCCENLACLRVLRLRIVEQTKLTTTNLNTSVMLWLMYVNDEVSNRKR